VLDHTYKPSYSGGRDRVDHGSSPAQIKSTIPSQSINWAWWYMPVILATQEIPGSRITVQDNFSKNMIPYLKNNKQKEGWRYGSHVKCVPSKRKSPNSNFSTTKQTEVNYILLSVVSKMGQNTTR
jgi:hypothetical protein